MAGVIALIFHQAPSADEGDLGRRLRIVRAALAAASAERLRSAGVDEARIVLDGVAAGFGSRLRTHGAEIATGGLIVLGSGAIPLARVADLRGFVETARSGGRRALANNFFSADIVALSDAGAIRQIPDLPSDNGLARWLAEGAGFEVKGLAHRWRLQVDLDSLADSLLIAAAPGAPNSVRAAANELPDELVTRHTELRAVLADRHAEVLVAGRTSAATLAHLESRTACRVRALVEERGLRASTASLPGRRASAPPGPQRPARSILGELLDRDGPAALSQLVERLADGALIDSRVLLAHQMGSDERAWPRTDDRLASDLLQAGRIADGWLRELTAAAAGARVPILLGGHTLVGPGLRLLTRGLGKPLGGRRGRGAK